MSAVHPNHLEAAGQAALEEAGFPPEVALALSRAVVVAICESLMGRRVSFGQFQTRVFRDRAIYEAPRVGNSAELAGASDLSPRQVRRIVRTQRRAR